MSFEAMLENNLVQMVRDSGDLGVFIAMFLESSIVPVPSEVVIITAGSIGISLLSIVVFGSLGSTLGAMVGFAIGRYAAMPVILKYGKFIFLKPHHFQKVEAFARKYGAASVLIGRLVPVVPFKVFSIAAGATDIPFVPFVVCTLIGVVPRMYVLALFGAAVMKYTVPTLIATAVAVVGYIIFRRMRRKRT